MINLLMKAGIIKVLQSFYSIYRCKKEGKRAFRCAKVMLNKGFYYIPWGSNEFRRIDKDYLKVKNLFLSSLFFNHYQGDSVKINTEGDALPTDRISFGLGSGKVVLMTDDKAYGFYDTDGLYLRAKENCIEKYKDFNYPCVRIFGYQDRNRLIIMERVNGEIIKDSFHNELMVKELLKLQTRSKIKTTEEGNVLFLQHGDAKFTNIVWLNNDYCFIDLDNIQYLPPLFDVFHYLASYGVNYILKLLRDNNNLVEEICLKANIDTNSNMIDSLFYKYISQYKEWGVSYGDCRFLDTEYVYKNCPLTSKLISSIYKKTS